MKQFNDHFQEMCEKHLGITSPETPISPVQVADLIFEITRSTLALASTISKDTESAVALVKSAVDFLASPGDQSSLKE